MSTERDRMAAILAAATPPDICGPEIPVAPARGPFKLIVPRALTSSEDRARTLHAGHEGRSAIRHADAFDVMEEQALRAQKRHADGEVFGFVPPFASDEVAMGRDYAALYARIEASGYGSNTLAGLSGGSVAGGAGRDIRDAQIADLDLMRRLRRRVGGGDALSVRRIRPRQRGERRAVPLLGLVDAVCLAELTLAQVLRGNGWPANGHHIGQAREALSGALRHMMGRF